MKETLNTTVLSVMGILFLLNVSQTSVSLSTWDYNSFSRLFTFSESTDY